MTGAPDISPRDIRELYEAQSERARASQRRADATSMCALMTSIVAIVVSLESPATPSVLLVVTMVLDCVFLHVETSGLVDSSFLTVHASVVALRKAAAGQQNENRTITVPGNLISLLAAPRGRADYFYLLRWRIRRIYVWLYSIVAAAWLIKLDTPSMIGGYWHPSTILARATVGPVAGPMTLGAVSLVLAAVLFIAIFGRSAVHVGQSG